METWEWIVIAAVAGAVVLVLLAMLGFRSRRRSRLRRQFGSEYDRLGERRLADIADTREQLRIRELPTVARHRYWDDWRLVEARFVSDPQDAVRSAQRIVKRVLEERGYPDDADADDLVAYVAADHPDVADRLRRSYDVLADGDARHRTESLRRAMLDLRLVLEDVLEREPVTY